MTTHNPLFADDLHDGVITMIEETKAIPEYVNRNVQGIADGSLILFTLLPGYGVRVVALGESIVLE